MTRFQPCDARFSSARIPTFVLLTGVLLTGLAASQTPAPQSSGERPKANATADRASETPGVLVQLNGALESLDRKSVV